MRLVHFLIALPAALPHRLTGHRTRNTPPLAARAGRGKATRGTGLAGEAATHWLRRPPLSHKGRCGRGGVHP